MKLPSNIRMLGYCDDWNASPGSTIRFKVSCDGVDRYRARIGRVICADLDPLGPGYRIDPLDTIGSGTIPGRSQPLHPGSRIRIDEPDRLSGMQRFSVAALIWPTLPGRGPQTVMSHWDSAAGRGWRLELDEAGQLALQVGGVRTAASDTPMTYRLWYLVQASIDLVLGTAEIGQRALREVPGTPVVAMASGELEPGSAEPSAGTPFLIAASACAGNAGADRFFEGKIERPALFEGAVSLDEAGTFLCSKGGTVDRDRIRASWDFTRQMCSDRIEDVSGRGVHGRTVNLPTRAMKGHNWDSSTMDWRSAPDQYGAIHFHADDIYDCAWETDFSWTVPDDAQSGYYAAILESEEGDSDFIPFFVRPRAGERTADLAVIACTATYLAYANTHVKVDMAGSEVMSECVNQLSPYERYLHEHRELGHSTYDHHMDGSGVCYSSRLRPDADHAAGPLHVQLRQRHAPAGVARTPGSALRHRDGRGHSRTGRRCALGISRDHHALPPGIHFDTDVGRLRCLPAGVVVDISTWAETAFTGAWRSMTTIPESWSAARTRPAFVPGRLNRGRDTCSSPANPVGLWRTGGRAPQSLVGVGYSSTMFARSTYYRRSEFGHAPEYAFIFDGIEPDEVIGDFGRRGGGAAGLEIDRWDPELGSPPNSVVLASSENVGIDGILSCEEYPIATRATDGLQHVHVRADMVYFETPNDGAVFSVGSITWITSLCHDNFDNNVARVTGNVLRRFLARGADSGKTATDRSEA